MFVGTVSIPGLCSVCPYNSIPTMHIHQRAPIDVEATLASLTLSEKISLLSGSRLDYPFGIPVSTHAP